MASRCTKTGSHNKSLRVCLSGARWGWGLGQREQSEMRQRANVSPGGWRGCVFLLASRGSDGWRSRTKGRQAGEAKEMEARTSGRHIEAPSRTVSTLIARKSNRNVSGGLACG